MPRIVAHGGHCCGVRHLYDFPMGTYNEERRKQVLSTYIRDYQGGRRNILIEVVLTDYQLLEWASTLQDAGFIPVARWVNSNSHNYCNMFLLFKAPRTRTDIPRWRMDEPPKRGLLRYVYSALKVRSQD